MKILLLTPMPPQREAPGAIPRVLSAQVAGLRERHDLTIVTVVSEEPGQADAAAELRRSGIEVHVIDIRRPDGAERWRRRRRLATTWAQGRYPWRTVWFADPRVQETIDALVARQAYDLAAVEDNSMATFRFPRALTTVLTEHEVRRARRLDWEGGSPRKLPSWFIREVDWRRWPRYQAEVWRRFDRIQVFTDRDARGVGELAPELLDRVRVNPFGIELPVPADPTRETPGSLLFVGNFTHPPNVDAALWLGEEIMPRLRARGEQVRLTIVGGGAPREVRALAGQHVQVRGEVPTVSSYLEAAAVVVAPVRIGGGMRMKVLHALAAGKAVVTTPRGAEGLTPPGAEPPFLVGRDVDEIVDSIVRLLRDDALRISLAARSRAFVAEHYSADAYGRRLEGNYNEAFEARRSAH